MVSWSARRGARGEVPGQRPRVEPTNLTRVDFTELTPDVLPFLGQAAYIQLEFFENLSRAVSTSPNLAAKEGLSASAGVALRKHHGLIEEIREHDAEPEDVMAPFAPALDVYRTAIAGADWWELLLGTYVSAGMLDDYFIRLADGLPSPVRGRVVRLLGEVGASPVLVRELSEGIATVPGLADRLALWGRRIVGDTLLVARSAIREGTGSGPEVEPMFTELIAAHTRRMDGLGLTA
ncbi:ferritin-like fold-containing protein [Agromyces mangrovi Wang et al. 2018]|uniref:ferritin-like fold-containing protein n=1 Tax=Agromyces mangrovi TaxID=1858653 RepID=UPI002573672F|nr:ferritin-like fold-containing protein [Agromyces mangrovi]